MSAIRKPINQDANLRFDPKISPANDIRSGKRREFKTVKGVKLRWPEGAKQRFDLFDAWHDVAMQIIHREKAGLRLMAISKKVVRWATGSIRISNEEMAERAGYCSPKTMSREVQIYTSLGLFVPKTEWKRPSKDKFLTVRELFLSLPNPLPEDIKLPNNEPLSLDNSGPDLDAVSVDNSGPGGRDNSGPATIDHCKGGDDAA
ncbi:hypothetical protein [Brucella intermedia]|uniref:hypothetical protein n=1 Tax=Brucella intermedia TaxID=94625 RepID=UPI0022493F41|nr:hypothetical protein [Brucella intermedia]